MCYDAELPATPHGTLGHLIFCMLLVLVANPLLSHSDPEGWEFLNSGYVAYNYPRSSRLIYAFGGWWWIWFSFLLCDSGTNEFHRRPFLAWTRDCSFGVFFCHVFWEALISYWLVWDGGGGQWNWYFKIIFLNVATFVGSYGWCWVVQHIPFVRLLCGLKPPSKRPSGVSSPGALGGEAAAAREPAREIQAEDRIAKVVLRLCRMETLIRRSSKERL